MNRFAMMSIGLKKKFVCHADASDLAIDTSHQQEERGRRSLPTKIPRRGLHATLFGFRGHRFVTPSTTTPENADTAHG